MSFGKMPQFVAPKEPDPVRLPSPDDPGIIEAQRRKLLAEAQGRQGRASTELTADASGSSSPAYSRTTLG